MSGLEQSLRNKISEKLISLKNRTFAKAMKHLLDEGVIDWKIDEFGVKSYYIKDKKKAERYTK